MKFIPLTKGFSAVVDDPDYDFVMQWKWHYSAGYAEHKERRNGKQIHIQMHRVLLNAPKGRLVDHKSGDTLDNRRQNLRLATHSTNAMNMRKHTGSSKYKGVCKEGNSFRVQIWKDNEKVFSAMAQNEIHAAMIYDLNAAVLFEDFARLNFKPVSLVIHE